MDKQELAELIDNQTKLFRQIVDVEKVLKDLQTKYGSLDIGMDEKQEIQKMSVQMSEYMDKLNSTKSSITERMDQIEKNYQTNSSSGNSGLRYIAPQKIISDQLRERLELKSLETLDAREALMQLAQKRYTHKFDADPSMMLSGRKTVTSLDDSAGPLQVPQFEERIIPPTQEEITLLHRLPVTTTNRSRVHWRREILDQRVDGTGIQSTDFTGEGQGTALGKSDFKFMDESEDMFTFGHTADIAIQILQDQGQLGGYIRNQMMYMSNWDMEDQVMFGNNTSKSLNSINAQATVFTPSLSANLNINQVHYLDVLRLAKLQGDNTYVPTTGFLLNRNDVAEIQVLKDSSGRYLFVNNGMPGSPGEIRPWGIPTIPSNHFEEGNFFALPLSTIELCIRKGWVFDMSTENKDNFEKLLVTLRIYGRAGIKIYYPNSIIKGNFANALQ